LTKEGLESRKKPRALADTLCPKGDKSDNRSDQLPADTADNLFTDNTTDPFPLAREQMDGKGANGSGVSGSATQQMEQMDQVMSGCQSTKEGLNLREDDMLSARKVINLKTRAISSQQIQLMTTLQIAVSAN